MIVTDRNEAKQQLEDALERIKELFPFPGRSTEFDLQLDRIEEVLFYLRRDTQANRAMGMQRTEDDARMFGEHDDG